MIVLITPTGARQSQFSLCSSLMKRQTYTGNVLWIIVDDAIPITTNEVTAGFREGWEIQKVHPRPQWLQGQNTQGRNMSAGLNFLTEHYNLADVECVFIIEDDDYYRPIYLERMMVNLKIFSAIGEKMTIYYNVTWRKYITNANTIHASLFQTAFTTELIPLMLRCHKHKFIDAEFWKLATNKYLFKENDLAIGMKGMPGRAGIGAGHGRLMNMNPDNDMKHLKKLIGGDAELYKKYYRTNGNTRYDILNKKKH